jgi:hypothetical protein
MNWPAAMACAFVVAAFCLGGSARADVSQLVVWRPLTALVLGAALILATFPGQKVPARIYGFLAALALLVLVQLVPLPASIWVDLPGRSILVEATSVTGMETPARPLSVVPARTWNALFALMGPAAMLILAFMAFRQNRRRGILIAFIALGLISALVGLLQIIGPRDSALYLYRVTNAGYGVGLFANRNHQAIMLACLFPMLATFAADQATRSHPNRLLIIFAIAAGIFLVPMILVTGSRAGLLFGLVGIAAIPLVYPLPFGAKGRSDARESGIRRSRWVLALAVSGLVAVVAITALFSRAEAIYRLLNPADTRNIRAQSLSTSWSLAEKYFPFGSGFGTFPDVYRIDEPAHLLAPTYLNQAHNDWLQPIIEGGVVAGALGLLFLIFWLVRARRAFADPIDQRARYARLGAIVSAMLLLASFVDYPIRVPALALLFAAAIAWMETKDSPSVQKRENGG